MHRSPNRPPAEVPNPPDAFEASEERWLHVGSNSLAMAIGLGSVAGAVIGPEGAIGAALVGLAASALAFIRRTRSR
jgi:hypothetical protein